MIRIVDTALYQWDTGRYVTTDIEADHIHFSNKGDSKAVIMELADSKAKIPDYLLQTGKQLCVYVVRNGITVESNVFSVNQRERPESYVYDEDQRNFIYALIASAETATMDAIKAAESATEAVNHAKEIADQAADAVAQVTQDAARVIGTAEDAAETANQAAQTAVAASETANKAATKAAHTAKSLMVVGEARGTVIHLDDAIDQYLVGLRVFGKTTQNGMPTPDSPVELESAGESGNIVVTVTGKNLLNVDESLTFTRNVNVYQYLPKGTYVVSCRNVAYGGDKKPVIVFYDKDKAIFNSELPVNGEKTITIAQNAYRWAVLSNGYDYSGSDGIGATIEKLMLRPVTITDSTYEPYKGIIATINTPNGLPGIPVASGGNYTDANGQQWICDEIDFARGVYVKRVGSRVLDGSSDEGWVEEAELENTIVFRTPISDSVNVGNVATTDFLCTHLNVGNIYGVDKEGVQHTVTLFYFRILKSRLASVGVSSFRTLLANSPMNVRYVLATSIETPLSEEELAAYNALYTYKGHTAIFNDAGAWMELEYVMDAKKYIDSQISAGILEATVE